MNCPFCKKEMQAGYVYSERRVSWQKRRPGSFSSRFDDIELTDVRLFTSPRVIGYCCEDCKKVIIDYTENA